MRIHLKFTKTADITEIGGVSIDHDDPKDWVGIVKKASQKVWAEYLVGERVYNNEQFTFEPLETEAPDAKAA